MILCFLGSIQTVLCNILIKTEMSLYCCDLTLSGRAREEQVSKASQFKQSPVSVNAVLELAKFYLN